MYQLHTSQHSHFFSSTTLWPKRPLNWRKLPSKCFYVAFYIKKSVIICISDLNYDTHNWFMWCRGANLFLFQFDVKLSNISSWLNWSFAIFRVQLVVTFTFFFGQVYDGRNRERGNWKHELLYDFLSVLWNVV